MRVYIAKEPKGKHTYAVYATVHGKRERHTHYLTKEDAEKFAKMFREPTARKMGFMYVSIVNEKVKKK
jgi:hypothetical protein